MPEGLRGLLRLAAGIPGSLYMRARRALQSLSQTVHEALSGVVIVTLTVPTDVPGIEEAGRLAYSRKLITFTGLANALDMASAAVPVRAHGLPSGIPAPIMLTAADSSLVLAVVLEASRILASQPA